MKRDYFYVWFVPLVWCGLTVFLSFHSGFKHELFFLGAIAGTWPFQQVSVFGLEAGLTPLLGLEKAGLMFVLAVGAVTMAAAGVLLDLLRIRKIIWFVLVGVLAAVFFVPQYIDCGGLDDMRGRHGYISGVVVAMCNWGIYVSTASCIVGGMLWLLFRCIWSKRVGSDGEVAVDE